MLLYDRDVGVINHPALLTAIVPLQLFDIVMAYAPSTPVTADVAPLLPTTSTPLTPTPAAVCTVPLIVNVGGAANTPAPNTHIITAAQINLLIASVLSILNRNPSFISNAAIVPNFVPKTQDKRNFHPKSYPPNLKIENRTLKTQNPPFINL